jgi:transposase InsO family protein
MEICFGTIKTELVHPACYPTRDAARHDLFAYIEGYYNRQRLHSALGYITNGQNVARLDPVSAKLGEDHIGVSLDKNSLRGRTAN